MGNTADQDPDGKRLQRWSDVDRRALLPSPGAWKGEDAGEFQLIGTEGRTLVFKNQPDYETPADADGDNVYKVTIVTLDGRGGRGEFDVCIAVMNIDEDGKITLRDEDGNELVSAPCPWTHNRRFDRPGWGRHRRHLGVGKVPADDPPYASIT